MKQILAHLRTGQVDAVEVPTPSIEPGSMLVRNEYSVISAGTERMLINFGSSSFISKALQQPDKVKQVFDKAKTDGVAATLSAVKNKLDNPISLGYSCAGRVIEVGDKVKSYFKVGDLVAGNGHHADIVCIPQNLCAKVPEGVALEEASFIGIAGVSMQGVRLAKPTIGECFVVTGLGLLGLFCVQLLKANGCRVLGLDFNEDRLALAKQFGAEVVNLSIGQDLLPISQEFSRGRGVDGVIVCAASRSSEMVNQAADICRMRGRVIQVGVTGLELDREKFFRKEIQFQVSNSTGPGKGDQVYEQLGFDYPVGFVRWTGQRNFEAVLDMMAGGRLDTKPLISHRFPLEQADAAYSLVCGSESSLGIVLEYDSANAVEDELKKTTIKLKKEPQFLKPEGTPSVAFIGSGNYATAVLIPAFKQGNAHLYSIASKTGVSGIHAGKKFGFEATTTNTDQLFSDPKVDAFVIATRHNTHSQYVIKALEANKHVFVEKPLAIKMSELQQVQDAFENAHQNGKGPHLIVGFNRRFAPQVQKMKELLSIINEPKSFIMTMNAGPIPPEHWIQDIAVGGGRIIGEACHYIDLMRFLSGSPIVEWYVQSMGDDILNDKVTINIKFKDGSFGSIHYFANGNKRFPKERIEVFCSGGIIQLDNFRKMKGYNWPGFSKMNMWRQDKGQKAEVTAFINAVKNGGSSPISFDELMEVSRTTIEIANAL